MDRSSVALCALFPLTQIAAAIAATLAVACHGPKSRGLLLAYLAWTWGLDGSPRRGGYRILERLGVTSFLRSAPWWRWSSSYFPSKLHQTVKLPVEDGPYIFVCHPHGIFGIGPMGSFGTDSTGFSKTFPGLTVHLLGHDAIFRIPIFREWCLANGCGTVHRKTCELLLSEKRCIALAPGGAKESLECQPGTMRLFLETRKGFVKLALRTGAALVPVLSFGENELYSTVQFEKATWQRKLQDGLQAKLGFALPLFCGLWWMPLLPKRLPVNTVVGASLKPPLSQVCADPSNDAIDKLHARYLEALQDLFETHKSRFNAGQVTLEFV